MEKCWGIYMLRLSQRDEENNWISKVMRNHGFIFYRREKMEVKVEIEVKIKIKNFKDE